MPAPRELACPVRLAIFPILRNTVSDESAEPRRVAQSRTDATTAGRSRKSSAGTFAEAEDVARRSPRVFQAPPGTRPVDVRSAVAKLRREAQARDLLAWAQAVECWESPEVFDGPWLAQGGVSGQEADVHYVAESGCYRKRNFGWAYEDWYQYFISVKVHNRLFPDAAYSFEAISLVNRHLCVIVSQLAVPSIRGAPAEEVAAYLSRFGFEDRGNNNYESDTYLIQDLHDENVLVGEDEQLHFIDTCIYVRPEVLLANPDFCADR